MKTYIPKTKEIKRNWHLLDATGVPIGRLASKIATLLSGKHKISYTPHLDLGDFVVVINAKKIKVGKEKIAKKVYYHYSGYPGGLKAVTLKEKLAKDPKWVIRHAVLGMLSKNKLRNQRIKRLKIFLDNQHPYKQYFKNQS